MSAEKTPTNNDRYITFALGQEVFGIPLLTVRELIAVPEFTPVPFVPKHFAGIMNLRGQVISVIDLRSKLSIATISSKKDQNAVIICEVGDLTMGIIVDTVESVITPTSEEIMDPPSVEGAKKINFVSHVCQHKGKLVLFLDVAKVLSVEDRAAVRQGLKAA